ncbi:hypothetical protein P22_2593 [Propionispora sp. 2/2-37]|uniref:MBL fold metallo-hydrolase n=1 Tax=Propionispora sp. 2/2-37 TaxID=1677858 RepID=UPI0006BB8F73|nr:MBL fold metallo-hydrolase [Propionispora sp. 2/2-37]CUH96503.1 hypothetical protein P22_2593 [Propionispora sp. 2/2-37]
MNYILSQLTEGTYAVVVDDAHSWGVPSYANIYVIKRGEKVILIDAGAREYRSIMLEALVKIGVDPAAVGYLLLTHGHWDHAAGSEMFSKARKFIHSKDLALLEPALAANFTPFSPGTAEHRMRQLADLPEIDIVHVNTHTPGSVVFFDRESKILYMGDFFCFFGEPLPEGRLISNSEVSRRGASQYVAGQAARGGEEFERFMKGLSRLLDFEPEFFCTGHGVILQGDIQGYLQSLWQSGRQNKE